MGSPNMNKSDTALFIRAMLTARRKMYTLPEFLKDFERDGGYSLPSYGHGSVLEFLKSIPETLQVIPVKNQIFLKLIVSQKSAHIRDAVVYGSIRRRRRRRRRRNRNRPGSRYRKRQKRKEARKLMPGPSENLNENGFRAE